MSKLVVGGILVLWLLSVFGIRHGLKSKIDSKDQIILEQNSKIEEVKLKNGEIAFQKVRAEADLKSLKKGYGFLEDSLKQMGIKAKNLKSALFVAQQTKGGGEGRIDTVKIVRNDTIIIARKMEIKEKYFKFNATIFPHGDFDYNYVFFDSLAIINITSRPHIFASRVHSVRVVNSNPNVRLSGITSLTIKEKAFKFHIGPLFGVTHDGKRTKPFVGVGVVYSMLRF